MTNLQALKNIVNYPLSDAQAEQKLIGRGVDTASEYSATINNSKNFRLAYADTLRMIITMVNLSQSGGSISAQNTADIRNTANAIYRQYGETLIGEQPSILKDASDKW